MSIYHKHHIVPKHAGGSDDPSNLVFLCVEEHAEAHRKLFEEYGRWQDELAWKTLSGIIGKEEAVRLAGVKANQGKKHSESSKLKIAAAASKRKHSKETIEKIRASRIGKPGSNKKRSLEFKKQVSEQMTGNNFGRFFKGKSWKKDPITGKRVWIDNSVNT